MRVRSDMPFDELGPRVAVVEHRLKTSEARIDRIENKIDRVLVAAVISAIGSLGGVLAILLDHSLRMR